MTSSIVSGSLALVVAALAAGCATDSPSSAGTRGSEPAASREYRTGSNIPVREPKTPSEHDKSRAGTPAESPKGAEAGKTN